MHPTSFSSRMASTSAMVRLASTVLMCCFIQALTVGPRRRFASVICCCFLFFSSSSGERFSSSLFFLPLPFFFLFFCFPPCSFRCCSCRSRFCSLFHMRCLAAATSLYVTRPMTSFSSFTTGRARTSYRVKRSSTWCSDMSDLTLRTGDVMKSPTVDCSRRLVSMSSSTNPDMMSAASDSSFRRTVAEAALGWPPPPYFSRSLPSLTDFILTPGLALPMMMRVLGGDGGAATEVAFESVSCWI
mmetsp:Transcript_1502/g.3882  ORF Transcript_1502/g.3882 Transcript_1502/m.3882 type:complete len:243 (-) Transcript_1502:2214-2942(-)